MYELLTVPARLYMAEAIDYDGPPRTPLVDATLRDCVVYFRDAASEEHVLLEVLLESGEWLIANQIEALLHFVNE